MRGTLALAVARQQKRNRPDLDRLRGNLEAKTEVKLTASKLELQSIDYELDGERARRPFGSGHGERPIIDCAWIWKLPISTVMFPAAWPLFLPMAAQAGPAL